MNFENYDTGVILFKPRRFWDERGFFGEVYSRKVYSDLGLSIEFVQANHSLSIAPGTLRGLHFQAPPKAQAKLVSCGRGKIFDVIVDIRRGSPTYGQWRGFDLSFENGYQLFVPIGFAHGFVTLEPNSEIVYQCSDYYCPLSEGSVSWCDRDLGIEWPKVGELTINIKDRKALPLKSIDSPFLYGVNS